MMRRKVDKSGIKPEAKVKCKRMSIKRIIQKGEYPFLKEKRKRWT
jgi:hypothetical protein